MTDQARPASDDSSSTQERHMTTPTTGDPRHAVIIGAGPGLGASLARRFGREGYSVTLVARNEQTLSELADELRAAHVKVDTAIADAGDTAGFRAALDEIAARVTPNVVVYNAALVASDSVLSNDVEYFANAYAVDVLGALSAAQVFTPAMCQAGTGTFLATGGYASVSPHPAYASLGLGKAALRNAVSMLHDELKPEGVHAAGVTFWGTIAPGTPLAPDVIADTYWNLHTQPVERWTAETNVDGK
jgi:short-subunit dehydrogenase